MNSTGVSRGRELRSEGELTTNPPSSDIFRNWTQPCSSLADSAQALEHRAGLAQDLAPWQPRKRSADHVSLLVRVGLLLGFCGKASRGRNSLPLNAWMETLPCFEQTCVNITVGRGEFQDSLPAEVITTRHWLGAWQMGWKQPGWWGGGGSQRAGVLMGAGEGGLSRWSRGGSWEAAG